jgi:hypothetical protein
MDESFQQAVVDFEFFLSGQRAPALVGHSLLTVLKADVRTVGWIVLNWVSKNANGNPLETTLAARNKVFDIFFYRVVRFDQIYQFFPTFEKALVDLCPPAYRPHLETLLARHPWEEIRPIGELRQMQVYALEERSEADVEEERFNEGIYRNATHNILSVDKRYDFSDEQVGRELVEHQAKVKGIFTDFVTLVKDRQAKKEIFVANESDADSVYETKRHFSLEEYLSQSVDLAVAFFNDDFLPQSSQMLDLVAELCRTRGFSFAASQRLQSKFELFSKRKIEEYVAAKPGRTLVGDVLGLFHGWEPETLLEKLFIEESRRERRVMLNVLESYGNRVYPLLLTQLECCTPETPWYYVRNLVYLLGRIVSPRPADRAQAVLLTANLLRPEQVRQVNAQCIATLTFIGGEAAGAALTFKLQEFRKSSDPVTTDLCGKIAQALIAFDNPRLMEIALEYGLKEWSVEYGERFAQTLLSPPTLSCVANRIRAEAKKLKRTFSLLGDVEGASHLLKAVAHQPTDEILSLCREIVGSLPARNALHGTAAEILNRPSPPPPMDVAVDRVLNRMLLAKVLPEALTYAWEAGLTGMFCIQTMDGTECWIEYEDGRALRADAPSMLLESNNAFYWAFLIDPPDIAIAFFTTDPARAAELSQTSFMTTETRELIHEALLQRGELKQIAGTAIRPDSRFSRRPAREYFLQFKDADDPVKCRLVWDALTDAPDIEALQKRTRLGKYDLYKVLLYLVRQNVVAIDGAGKSTEGVSFLDGLAMLETNVRRIRKKPLIFATYKTSAEVCEEIAAGATDETVKFAMDVLGRYFLNAYRAHRFFVASNADIALQVVQLVAAYARAKMPSDKRNLLDYIGFAFQEEETQPGRPETTAVVEAPVSQLQKLENIQLVNDAFDEGGDTLFDDQSLDDMFGALEAAMNTHGAGGPTLYGDSGLTAAEEAILIELYDNIAVAYVKPLKDFIREIQMNRRIRRPTSLEWIEMVEPSVNLLHGSAEKMNYQKICSALKEMQETLQSQRSVPDQAYLTEPAAERILGCYANLAELLPKTFALELSDADLASKKEVLVVKFILKQIPEINEKLLNRIILAGLSTFDKFMQSSPDEIAAVTGLSKRQGEDVFMKFYQYRHMYYRHDEDGYKERFFRMFDVKLSILREIHSEIESLSQDALRANRDAELRERIAGLKSDRQRTLWGIFILLCIKEEYDLIESVQQSLYDVRIRRLEEYLDRLAAAL